MFQMLQIMFKMLQIMFQMLQNTCTGRLVGLAILNSILTDFMRLQRQCLKSNNQPRHILPNNTEKLSYHLFCV